MAISIIYKGKGKTFHVSHKDSAGAVIDITGWTLYFTAKKKLDDPDSEAVLQKTVTNHVDAINGLSDIVFLNADTVNLKIGEYFYDIQSDDATGENKGVIKNKLKVEQPVRIG